MSTLGDERQAILDALVGDYTRFAFVPDRLVPPAAIVTPSDPYLERRDTDPFGTLTASFEVWLVQANATNETVTAALDAEIETQAQALKAVGFAVERVSEPFMYAVQNGQFLTSIIYVTTGVTLT